MAICRIYLFTYKRNYLLPRAVQSLVNQTLKDWICEIHNDGPSDTYPEKYIQSLKDSRFIIKNHPVNLGGTASFNLAFAGCDEKYASILEDDNWWEPVFLEEMTGLMNNKPELDIAWSNMNVWKEGEQNTWTNAGITVWPESADQMFTWPQPAQALGALHSIGAMMWRSINAPGYIIPKEVLLDSVELVRERAFKHPVYLHAKPLANFSITNTTNRSTESWKWTACQVMQLSSMVMASDQKKELFKHLLTNHQGKKSGTIVNFFLANLFYIKDGSLYQYFYLHDWLTCSRWLISNNFKLLKLKKHLKAQAAVYDFLLTNTRQRFKESV